MNGAAVSALLIHLLGLSLISFGGIPSVLPDLRHFVVVENAGSATATSRIVSRSCRCFRGRT